MNGSNSNSNDEDAAPACLARIFKTHGAPQPTDTPGLFVYKVLPRDLMAALAHRPDTLKKAMRYGAEKAQQFFPGKTARTYVGVMATGEHKGASLDLCAPGHVWTAREPVDLAGLHKVADRRRERAWGADETRRLHKLTWGDASIPDRIARLRKHVGLSPTRGAQSPRSALSPQPSLPSSLGSSRASSLSPQPSSPPHRASQRTATQATTRASLARLRDPEVSQLLALPTPQHKVDRKALARGSANQWLLQLPAAPRQRVPSPAERLQRYSSHLQRIRRELEAHERRLAPVDAPKHSPSHHAVAQARTDTKLQDLFQREQRLSRKRKERNSALEYIEKKKKWKGIVAGRKRKAVDEYYSNLDAHARVLAFDTEDVRRWHGVNYDDWKRHGRATARYFAGGKYPSS